MIVKIGGVVISNFITNELTFSYDSVADVFSFTFPFFEYWEVSERNKIRDYFKPLAYKSVQVYDDNRKLLLTGTILNHKFKDTANGSELSISGYSRTGILDDCPNVPKSENLSTEENEKRAISTNFANLTFLEFVKTLVNPFGISVEVDSLVQSKMDEVFEQQTTDADDSVASTLAKMATLKNVVMRTSPNGNLKFTQIDPELKPVAKFSTGDGVVTDISLDINGQAMHSEIHIAGTVDISEDTGEDKAKTGNTTVVTNPLITTISRPGMKKQGTETGAVDATAKAALAEELKNIQLTINCKGWKNVDDGTLQPGQLVSVKAAGCYLYNYQTFLVRSIQLKENNEGKSSTINCVLPQTMTGDQPKLIFN